MEKYKIGKCRNCKAKDVEVVSENGNSWYRDHPGDMFYPAPEIDQLLKDARELAKLADCAPGDGCFDKYRILAARIIKETDGV